MMSMIDIMIPKSRFDETILLLYFAVYYMYLKIVAMGKRHSARYEWSALYVFPDSFLFCIGLLQVLHYTF